MFDRFDHETQLTMERARAEAARLNHGRVHTEHLLLALLSDPLIADLVSRMGMTRSDVISAIEQCVQRGLRLVLEDHVPHTVEARDALDSAVEEADGFGHALVRNAHVLLGLIKEPHGVAGRVLESKGATLDGTRLEVLEFLAEYDLEEVGAA